MIFSVQEIYLWMLILCRCGGLLAGFPFGGENNGVPGTVKVLLACALSYIVLTITPLKIEMPHNVFMYFFLAFREVITGLAMGFVIKISFAMIELAGHIIANEIGLNAGEMFNPLTESNTSFPGTMLIQFGIVIFFITGLDKELLRCFVQSYQILDFETSFRIQNLSELSFFIKDIFILSFKIAAPLILLNFLINFGFAILGKAAPKINVFFLSFPLRIFSGFCLLALTIYLIYAHIASDFQQLPQKILTLIQS